MLQALSFEIKGLWHDRCCRGIDLYGSRTTRPYDREHPSISGQGSKIASFQHHRIAGYSQSPKSQGSSGKPDEDTALYTLNPNPQDGSRALKLIKIQMSTSALQVKNELRMGVGCKVYPVRV